MLNFLQQKNKKQIITEYLFRVLVIKLSFILTATLLLIILFLPSFFFIKYKNTTLTDQSLSVQKQAINVSTDPIILIKNANKLLVALTPDFSTDLSFSHIIDKVISLKNSGIKILSIQISNDINKTDNKIVVVGGVANTRDDLTLFQKDIINDGYFKNVLFPVANFIKNADSEFTATITLK